MDLTTNNKDKKLRRKPPVDLANMGYGKVPPQAKELEEAVLGAIMIEKRAYDVVAEILTAESFYVDANQKVFAAMKSLAQRNMPIDMLTVLEELKTKEELEIVGGPYYVTKLTNSVVSSANIESHALIIFQKWLAREMIRIGGELVLSAYEDSSNTMELLEQHEKDFTAITMKHNIGDNSTMIGAAMVKVIQRIEELRGNESHLTGVPSGFPDIDRITHGWQATDLIVLAARPSVGKTALALNIARNAAMNDFKPVAVAFFSLEMSTGQLVERIMSAESEIWLEKITTGQVQDEELKQIYNKSVAPMGEKKFIIDDTAALRIMDLKSKARKLKRKHPTLGLIIIDYLQLMSGENDRNGNREQEISKISRELKGLAKELYLPIIALSQLSREVEKRKGEAQRPILSDLRESGAIEQDADMVMFMYRPEYYDINANEMGESNKGLTIIEIAKHRHGKLAKGHEAIKLKGLLHIQKFVPWEDSISNQFPASPGNWRPLSSSEKDSSSPF